MTKPRPTLAVRPLLLLRKGPGHQCDKVDVHGGFLAKKGYLAVDVDIGVVPGRKQRGGRPKHSWTEGADDKEHTGASAFR